MNKYVQILCNFNYINSQIDYSYKNKIKYIDIKDITYIYNIKEEKNQKYLISNLIDA